MDINLTRNSSLLSDDTIPSFIPSYRPDIDYTWTTTNKSGNRKLINAGESNPEYKATMYSGRGVKFNGTDQICKIDVKQGQILYKFDVTNNKLVTENITFTGVYKLGKVGGIGDYEDILYSNIIVSNSKFNNYEFDYLYNYPEKFLYHEKQTDGTFVAKSEILSQSQIDNIVAHFPMCETDGYVRNMIGYSELSPIVDTGGTYIADDDEVATHDYSDGVHTVEVTTAGTNSVRPFVRTTMSENFEVGATYLYSFDIKVISGTFGNYSFYLNAGDAATKHYSGNVTSMYDVTIAGYDTNQIGIVCDGTNTFKIEIANIQVKKLTSTYPIENFTNTARDDAKNLTTGLQTCLWKRDVLGVPTAGSFDEITFDGVGYVDTGWVPTLKPNDYTIELIIVRPTTVQDWYNKYLSFGASSGQGTIEISKNSSTGGTIRFYGVTKSYNFRVYNYMHIVLASSKQKVYITLNGDVAHQTADTPKNYTRTQTLQLGKYASDLNQNINTGAIRLFKVHTTPQEPAKLYNDALKKGLLS